MFPLKVKSRPHEKKNRTGKTCVIDSGLPIGLFRDYVSSFSDHVDFVKFGWGTSLVTKDIKLKIQILIEHGIDFSFGGSLFEVAWKMDAVEQYFKWCADMGLKHIEVSDGTYKIPHDVKLKAIELAAKQFTVLSEVGLKGQEESQMMHPKLWVEQINSELSAGSDFVITEAREAGNSGICRPNGELRFGLIEEILDAGIPTNKLIFEAPTKTLQTFFIKRVGKTVNLANIQFHDVVGVETLRRGIRSDTMDLLEWN
ncbi:phosphosulfolactate synthase [Bdellovibrio reynosensis]|uniref:Phosphosulfolactate synthase n=1 Tax=Bdellovibrio reynosensis TaxID=2835041 RepID=A0ABY4CJ27_9BACT|nr:phosphosulfolactate synthase [Bdellovibrio reynosensis]UOF02245.1 phosphosulfolactate synthase [Bdellovibrio reynosensis]